jgi:hypothetical protein
MNRKVSAAIRAFRSRGHTVKLLTRHGVCWYEIDGKIIASTQEMEELGNRIHSRLELEDALTQKWSKAERN